MSNVNGEGEAFHLSTDGHRDYYSAPGAYRTGDGGGDTLSVTDYSYRRGRTPSVVVGISSCDAPDLSIRLTEHQLRGLQHWIGECLARHDAPTDTPTPEGA